MELKELCEKISLPQEVTKEILLHGEKEKKPERLYDLTKKETAKAAYEALNVQCKKEYHGFDMLSWMLLAALHTHELYENMGIDDGIFFETMKCFSRFVREHKESFGFYGFDRAWWTYRQLSMTLFRVGELEYEYVDRDQTIHLHIPSDAGLELALSEKSLEEFLSFTEKFYPQNSRQPVTVSSWLLSPALDELLNPGSRILEWKRCFDVVEWKKEDKEFLQWVYGRDDLSYEELPEKTSLQKNMKAYLLDGGLVGCAKGILKRNPDTGMYNFCPFFQ